MMNDEQKPDKKQRLIRKGKKVQEPVNTELVVNIFEGFTKDERDLTQPHMGSEYFRVMAWIEEEEEQGTSGVRPAPNKLRRVVSSAAFPAWRIVLVVAAVVDAVMFPTFVTVASVAATLSGV
ncbi:hypothetical protein F2Q69_00016324 [Brassica cretica]|uniref:Uncharacterized protein n=1 Tax=Brassica cretica TaxID=69181 RepID=A0A8S9QXR5_BRACR|nr:hypothetical protein F2Q69_00016324 [Brassica cretica]